MLDSSARADVQIAGRGYQVATGPDAPQWMHRTIPLLRRQFDVSAEAGESSLNPEGPWRRTIDNWYRGAGQVDQDGTDARVGQFKDSRSADVWTKGEVRALPAAATVSSTLGELLVTGDDCVYVIEQTTGEISRIRDGAVINSATLSDGPIESATTDGVSLWVNTSVSAGGIHRYPPDLSSVVKIINNTSMNRVGHVGDRLISFAPRWAYDLSSEAYAATLQATPSPFMTLPYSGVDGYWQSMTWGQGFIYLATNSGTIYRTAVKDDGTALDVPVIAGTLPAGERLREIYSYLGFMIIATDRGYRMALADDRGDLTFGATIELIGDSNTDPQMIGYGPYVYVTSDGDSTDSSVGAGVRRIDLSVLNDTTPAHAPDIWVEVTADVVGVGLDGETLYFSTSPTLYKADSTLASDGWVETGEIDFGLSSDKVVKGITADVGAGSVTFTVYDDEDNVYPIGVATPVIDTISIPTDIMSRSFRVRAELSSDAVLRSFTLLAFPTGVHTDEIQVPVMLAEHQHLQPGDMMGSPQALTGVDGKLSTGLVDDLNFLKSLRDAGGFITYLEGESAYTVQVTGVGFIPDKLSRDRRAPAGVAVVTLKTSGVLGTVTDPVVPSQVGTPLVGSGDTQLSVSWEEPYDGGSPITDYDVRYSSNAGSTWTEVAAGVVSSYDITSLANGTEYLVGVRAVNLIGDGDWSPSVAATPAGLPATPTGLTVTG